MRIELCNCEQALLDEINHPQTRRNDVAKTYSMALRSSEAGTMDWSKVNKAIIDRWSKHALQWIKTRAWNSKCWDKDVTP